MILFYCPNIVGGLAELDAEEAHHCTQVLRRQIGDTVHLIDGTGGWFEGVIAEAGKRRCMVQIQKEIKPYQPRNHYLHIALAPTKNIDRTEWFVEKATEIGVDEITMLLCKRSERKQVRMDRLEKVAVTAMKQSLRAFLPKLNELTTIEALMKKQIAGHKYIAYCGDDVPAKALNGLYEKGEPATILIGPEGDFTPDEVEKALTQGYQAVSLGAHRLRTETAGLVACHTVNLKNE